MKQNNKKYNAIDFAHYHSGDMPPDERHALEKAALEDPFLADALDGYVYSKDTKKELDEIKMRLDEKSKKRKLFTISSLSPPTWWKIAAMVILFAAAGYYFYATNSEKETSFVVKNDAPKKQNPVAISPAQNDTTAREDDLAFEKPSGKNENRVAKLSPPTIKSMEVSPRRKTTAGEIKTEKERSTSGEVLADTDKNSVAMNNDKIASLNIIRKDLGKEALLHSPDTTALVAASLHKNDSGSFPGLAMNQKATALNEVVVTGYGTRRKKNMTGSDNEALQGKVSGVQITRATPYPKDGKEKFDQFIKDNAVPVFDSTGKRITANILLSFTLSRKGKPTHIKVLESSCKACEKEATTLLENGAKWIGKRGNSATVRIQF